MANPIKGEAKLKLADGREFTIVLDFEALIEAEQAYGKPLQMTMVEASMGYVGAIRAMLWGALRAKHPDLTLREAGEMFRDDPDAVTKAVEDFIAHAFPKRDDAEGKDGKNPLGKTSGPSGARSDLIPTPSGVPLPEPSS